MNRRDQLQKICSPLAENGAAADLEYPTQQMLGWTAGIYRYFVEQGKNS